MNRHMDNNGISTKIKYPIDMHDVKDYIKLSNGQTHFVQFNELPNRHK